MARAARSGLEWTGSEAAAHPYVVPGSALLQRRDLRSRGLYQLVVRVRMTPQAPAAGRRLGKEDPRPPSERGVARRFGDECGESLDDRDLLVAIQRTGIRQDLDTHVVESAGHVRDRVGWHLMDEGRRVLAEHRDLRHTLDAHDRCCGLGRQAVPVGECALLRVDIDHRHPTFLLSMLLVIT